MGEGRPRERDLVGSLNKWLNDKAASYFGEDAVLLSCPSVLRRLEREAWD